MRRIKILTCPGKNAKIYNTCIKISYLKNGFFCFFVLFLLYERNNFFMKSFFVFLFFLLISFQVFTQTKNEILLNIAGNSLRRNIELLLPKNNGMKSLLVNGQETDFKTKTIEKSKYICVFLEQIPCNNIQLLYA